MEGPWNRSSEMGLQRSSGDYSFIQSSHILSHIMVACGSACSCDSTVDLTRQSQTLHCFPWAAQRMRDKVGTWIWVCLHCQFCSMKSILLVPWIVGKTTHWHTACDRGVLPCLFFSAVTCAPLRDVLTHPGCSIHVSPVGLGVNLLLFLFLSLQHLHWLSFSMTFKTHRFVNVSQKGKRERKEGNKGRKEGRNKETSKRKRHVLCSPMVVLVSCLLGQACRLNLLLSLSCLQHMSSLSLSSPIWTIFPSKSVHLSVHSMRHDHGWAWLSFWLSSFPLCGSYSLLLDGLTASSFFHSPTIFTHSTGS